MSDERGKRTDTRGGTGRENERPLLGGSQLHLKARAEEGFERRFFNDEGTRIEDALAAGWVFVQDEAASEEDGRAAKDSRLVGTFENGRPKSGILMQKPRRLYDEDMARKQDRVDARETAIFRDHEPELDQNTPARDRGKFYTKRAERSAT